MFNKIMKQIKKLSQGSSERRQGNYRRGSSSSQGRSKRSPMSGSSHYKRKGRSSS